MTQLLQVVTPASQIQMQMTRMEIKMPRRKKIVVLCAARKLD